MEQLPVSAPGEVSGSNGYAAGLLGEVYRGGRLNNLADALAVMEGAADATFVADSVDYAKTDGSLADLLGSDAQTLSGLDADAMEDQFALRLSGEIYLEAGSHRFSNITDDGFRLTINGQVVAEYADQRGSAATRGTIEIAESGWYSINVDYFEAGGGAELRVRHSFNGGASSDLTADQLRHGTGETDEGETPVIDYAAGLMGEVFRGGTLNNLADALVRMQGTADAVFVADSIDYAKTNGSLANLLGEDAQSLSGVDANALRDQFALRLSGEIYLEAGTHRFDNITDDGFRLTVDGQVVAEYADPRASAGTSGAIEIAEAGWYSINVDYFEARGGAELRVRHSVNGGESADLDANRLRHATGETDGGESPVDPEPVANTAPDAQDDTRQIDEDGSLRLNPLTNDSDADGDALAITAVGQAANGTVTLNADGTVSYVPNANFNGRDSFSYSISDGRGGTDSARVVVDVRAQNDAPVARNDGGFSVQAGQVLVISIAELLANDGDLDGDVLSLLELTDVTNGSAEIVGDQIRFTAAGEGSAGFGYILSDGRGGRDSATVSVAVSGAPVVPEPSENTPPVAQNDTRRINEDGSLRLNPLANDSDADGDALSITSVGEAANGTVTLNADGTVSYAPNANFNGRDSFTYRVSDGNGGTDTASVIVDVTAVNDAPIARNDGGFSVEAGQVINIDIADLLANDSDVDGNALSILRLENVTNGSAEIVNGQIRFTGSGEGNGGFSYVLSDGQGGQGRANVSVAISDPGTDGGDGSGPGGGINPPRTPEEIAEFVEMVRNQAETPMEGHPAGMQMHMAALDLVSRSDATHIAVNSGDWNDPSTWHNGQVPGDDARVLVPEGITVGYSEVNDASIFTVRVDGLLRFATDQDSRLLVDTMVVSPTGRLEIGTEDNPVRANTTVDIVFADNGNINVGWDPSLLSRGMIAMGEVDIVGLEKTSHLKVQVDAMAGDTTLTLAEAPTGWQVGDKLVLTGTYQQGFFWNNTLGRRDYAESQDEEVYITAIDGNRVTLNRPLTFDHDTPRDDLKAYVANMTRNVTFSSEGGEDLPEHQRGHVMFMHNDDVDVRYAGFNDLGRTDKKEYAGPAESFGGVGNLSPDANVEARYPFHFHEAGVDDIENPAIAIGNVVDGSPGWGFVQHSSNANLTNNVAFDVWGASFVAEDGNETGTWYRNIAIKSQGWAFGDGAVKGSEVDGNDARTGDGFWLGGRLVEVVENVAANTTNGFVWFHRGDRDRADSENIQQSEIAYGSNQMSVDKPPIQGFRDNEAFGTHSGIIVVKDGANQGHDVRSVFDGFLNWETREGIFLSYTGHYTFLDVDLVGQRDETPNRSGLPENGAYHGVQLATNAVDVVFNGIRVDGFDYAFQLQDNHNIDTGGRDGLLNTVIDGVFTNIGRTDISEALDGQLIVLNSSDLTEGRLEFRLAGDGRLSSNERLYLDGVKTDSIGSVDRSFEIDRQGPVNWEAYLQSNGYWRLADGTPVMLLEDYIADRATGELQKQMLVFRLESGFGSYTFNGTVSLGGPAPVARDDRGTTSENTDLRMNLVANDSDPDGGRVYVDGLIHPENGDVFQQDDGTVIYRPNQGFVGTDRFYYWAADEEGNFTRGEAIVTVQPGGDLLRSAMAADSFDL
ncbi:Ig-like domain-containing protein [Paracoccus marinaquae]|uniref:Tandem-95 repeat protein n=1 Tax=Paracoccus marinaquae TaxID=2841926 RepID=A0ABS6AIN3_9RHOB|nr:Ig-like domain-containing protein [Paracoccus marinaquae]MBU3029241.1 tandem-95 repeat protein [Paracoccus marinaquae]